MLFLLFFYVILCSYFLAVFKIYYDLSHTKQQLKTTTKKTKENEHYNQTTEAHTLLASVARYNHNNHSLPSPNKHSPTATPAACGILQHTAWCRYGPKARLQAHSQCAGKHQSRCCCRAGSRQHDPSHQQHLLAWRYSRPHALLCLVFSCHQFRWWQIRHRHTVAQASHKNRTARVARTRGGTNTTRG